MIKSSKAQHPGKKKENNDDFLSDPTLGLYVLCDGSSDAFGHWIAELAKNIIHARLKGQSKLIETYNTTPNSSLRNDISHQIEAAIQAASHEIMDHKTKNLEKAGSYTTLDVLLVLCDSCLIAHVGNGRIYLIREDKVKLLTEDDTYHALKLKQGLPPESLKETEKKHLTQVLGKDRLVPVKVQTYSVISNDIFLMCSDGFYFAFENQKVFCQMALEQIKTEPNLDTVTQNLVNTSVKNGTDDNTSLIIVSNWKGEAKTEGISTNLVKQQIELVRNFRMFRGIRDNDYYLLQVHSLFNYLKVPKGKPIVTQGDESCDLFIILGGKANVLINGVAQTLLGPGNAIGEYGLFTGDKRSATVIATEDMQLISITKSDLDAFCYKNVDFGYLLLKGVVLEILSKTQK